MLDWSLCPLIERSPERLSDAVVFQGTRVPVAALLENLRDGASVAEFLEHFPGVTGDQVDAVLGHVIASLNPVQLDYAAIVSVIAQSKPEDYDGHTEFDRLSPAARLEWLDAALQFVETARRAREKRDEDSGTAERGEG